MIKTSYFEPVVVGTSRMPINNRSIIYSWSEAKICHAIYALLISKNYSVGLTFMRMKSSNKQWHTNLVNNGFLCDRVIVASISFRNKSRGQVSHIRV